MTGSCDGPRGAPRRDRGPPGARAARLVRGGRRGSRPARPRPRRRAARDRRRGGSRGGDRRHRATHTDAPIVLVTPAQQRAAARPRPTTSRAARARRGDTVAAVVESACAAATAPTRSRRPRTSVFTVFSPKGGTGKSVIATNLAVALAADGVKHAARRPRPRARRRRAHARHRSAADDLRPRRRARRARRGEARRLRDPARQRAGRARRAAPARAGRARHRGEARTGSSTWPARHTPRSSLDTPASFHGTVLTAIDRDGRAAGRLRARHDDAQERPRHARDAPAPAVPRRAGLARAQPAEPEPAR